VLLAQIVWYSQFAQYAPNSSLTHVYVEVIIPVFNFVMIMIIISVYVCLRYYYFSLFMTHKKGVFQRAAEHDCRHENLH